MTSVKHCSWHSRWPTALHHLRYWIDAKEERGTVYLFGKVQVHGDQAAGSSSTGASEPQYTSCCVVVKNINRSMFVLPKLTGENDDEGNPKRYGMVGVVAIHSPP